MLPSFLSSLPRLAVAVILVATGPAAHSANAEDCKAANPTLKGAVISEKLKRCNGVLKPSKMGDPDMVIKTPSIDDPLTVHPKQLPGNEGVPK